MEAFRAVNQAIGRVLRHIDDFGVIALLDSRYVRAFIIGLCHRFSNVPHSVFPSWLRPSIKNYDSTPDFFHMTERFFRDRDVEMIVKKYSFN